MCVAGTAFWRKARIRNDFIPLNADEGGASALHHVMAAVGHDAFAFLCGARIVWLADFYRAPDRGIRPGNGP
jgi:hypothetical protein